MTTISSATNIDNDFVKENLKNKQININKFEIQNGNFNGIT